MSRVYTLPPPIPRLLSILHLILMLLLAPAADSRAQSIPIKGHEGLLDVATWNIEHFGNEGAAPNDDARQFENVRQVILQSGIDLWAVQEIDDPTDFDRLIDSLGAGWSGVLSKAGRSPFVGFIYDSDVIRIRRASSILTQFSSGTTNYFASRPPLQLEAEVTVHGKKVNMVFIVVHMKCCSDTDSYNRRLEASKRLKNHIDIFFPGSTVIVLGDWNDELTCSISSCAPTPYLNFLEDASGYSFVTSELERTRENTFCSGSNESCTSGSTLDHILITNELFGEFAIMERFAELIEVLRPYVSSTSDHLPVFASFNLSTDTSIEELPAENFGIQGIYPTPTASTAVVEYSAGAAALTLVEVYDLLGRHVAVLDNGYRSGGIHRVDLATGHLAPGAYFISIQSEGRREVRPFFVSR